ncbi:hypothetical protein GCM10023317_96640 [Actinopolymorpha pittospori]
MPKHYEEARSRMFVGWRQPVCSGSGSRNFYEDGQNHCRRRRSGFKCPACGKSVKLREDGRIPVHEQAKGHECPASKDNRDSR